MLDFIGLNNKIKIYISSMHKKQTPMYSGKQTRPLIVYDKDTH